MSVVDRIDESTVVPAYIEAEGDIAVNGMFDIIPHDADYGNTRIKHLKTRRREHSLHRIAYGTVIDVKLPRPFGRPHKSNCNKRILDKVVGNTPLSVFLHERTFIFHQGMLISKFHFKRKFCIRMVATNGYFFYLVN